MSECCSNNSYCNSCMVPLETEAFKGVSEIYCKYCTDSQGNLLPYEQVLEGTAQFFLSWQKGIDTETARTRAKHYLKAMPAWADR